VLTALIEESDDARREHLIEVLLDTRARPTIERVIARHTRPESAITVEDGQDVASVVLLRLVCKLRLVPDDPDESIEAFEDYVAKLTYNAICDLLRRRFPQRSRLKNRLRYLLTHDARFALWLHDDVVACGLAKWSGRAPSPEIPDAAPEGVRDPRYPAESLLTLFRAIGRPVSFESLLRFLVGSWKVVEGHNVDIEELRDRRPSPLAVLESREYLEALWKEIRLLRPMQRTALLLNMRDHEGMNALVLILFVNIASFDEIAGTIGLSPERLSEIWGSLPLDDLAIGEMLGATRQQVINLRKSARERLARRMAARSEPRQ
jgi:hypothetical protein